MYESVPSTYDVVIDVFCVIDWVLVIPVDTTIPVFNIVSFVKVDEFTNCVPFHRKISPFAIDVIEVSVNKLWVKFVFCHLEEELYINPWFSAGDEIERSVSAANVDDPLDKVVLTHFDEDDLYCNTCRFAGEFIVTSECFENWGQTASYC